MWLLNARTLALENLDRPEEHRYVTLSHRWRRNADEEVTFQDMADLSRARLKPGFHKIQRTCAKALDKGVGYAWVDTCCIDKSSSAALSEALNSLFAWYKASSYCFAYLEDLVGETTSDPAVPPPDRSVRPVRDVTESEWFTRGWTLPELIAPEVVEFYDASWRPRGDKFHLREPISQRTGIDVAVLQDSELLSTVSLGRRMSWAADRVTSRAEDLSYCLLGLFDVNLPILYGEGREKAFRRLQEEIIKSSNDLSLFAWVARPGVQDDRPQARRREVFRGLFARSPAEFADCGTVRAVAHEVAPMREFALVNNGCLRIDTRLAPAPDVDGVLALDCTDGTVDAQRRERRLGIYLMRTREGFVRYQSDRRFASFDRAIWTGPPETVYIRRDLTPIQSDRLLQNTPGTILFHFHLPRAYGAHRVSARPTSAWDPNGQRFATRFHRDFTGCLQFYIRRRYWRFVVVCGLIDPGARDPQVIDTGVVPDGAPPAGAVVPWMAIFTDQDPVAAHQLAVIDKVRKSGGDDEGALAKLRRRVFGWHLDRDGRLPLREMATRTKIARDDYGKMSYRLEPRVERKAGMTVFVVNVFVRDLNELPQSFGTAAADDGDQGTTDSDESYLAGTGEPQVPAPEPPPAVRTPYVPRGQHRPYPNGPDEGRYYGEPPRAFGGGAPRPPYGGPFQPMPSPVPPFSPQYGPAGGGYPGYFGPQPPPPPPPPPQGPPPFGPAFRTAPDPYGTHYGGHRPW